MSVQMTGLLALEKSLGHAAGPGAARLVRIAEAARLEHARAVAQNRPGPGLLEAYASQGLAAPLTPPPDVLLAQALDQAAAAIATEGAAMAVGNP